MDFDIQTNVLNTIHEKKFYYAALSALLSSSVSTFNFYGLFLQEITLRKHTPLYQSL
jgi:hypothetical protein